MEKGGGAYSPERNAPRMLTAFPKDRNLTGKADGFDPADRVREVRQGELPSLFAAWGDACDEVVRIVLGDFDVHEGIRTIEHAAAVR